MSKDKIQVAESLTADFEENTWTFEMKKDFIVTAGKFVIIPIDVYNELAEDLQKIKKLLEK